LYGAALRTALDRAVGHASVAGASVVLSYADTDRIFPFNDRHGHGCSDTLLRRYGGVFQETIGEHGTVGRIGGDEFLFILPGATSSDAVALTNRLRQAVASIRVPDYQGLLTQPLTVSFGIAVFPEHGTDAAALLLMAEEATYQAKEQGRNRACVAGAPLAGQS
jgi:diguanylate cyclase (GGDEF)-like protein